MKQKESQIGKNVILKKQISGSSLSPMDIAMLMKYPSKIIFEGELIGGDGLHYMVVGLKNRGELVIDRHNNLALFLWAAEDGEILHFFEEILEAQNDQTL